MHKWTLILTIKEKKNKDDQRQGLYTNTQVARWTLFLAFMNKAINVRLKPIAREYNQTEPIINNSQGLV